MKIGMLISAISILAFGCHKDDHDGCLGCGIDTSIKEFEFTISGDLHSNCQGAQAANKTIELHLYYNTTDSLKAFSQTDSTGHFNIVYKKILPSNYSQTSKWLSEIRLLVKDDSTTFYLPGLTDMHNLMLILNDSLDLTIYLEAPNSSLDSDESIIYWFGSDKTYDSTEFFTKMGPSVPHEIINEINTKWRTITINDGGNPELIAFWKIIRPQGHTTSTGFTAKSSKTGCLMRKDSILLTLN